MVTSDVPVRAREVKLWGKGEKGGGLKGRRGCWEQAMEDVCKRMDGWTGESGNDAALAIGWHGRVIGLGKAETLMLSDYITYNSSF
jgi:hypothetical protein